MSGEKSSSKQWVGCCRDGARGAVLIEVLIALAILGLISVVFIGGIYSSLQAARLADERSNALTIAKSQIEYARDQDYSETDWEYSVDTSGSSPSTAPSWWATAQPSALDAEFDGYSVTVSGEPVAGIDWDGESGPDEGIRVITATVYHHGNEVFVLSNYEVDR